MRLFAFFLAIASLTACGGEEVDKEHWVHLKGFKGAVARGSVKSMEPVQLSVWRYRSDKVPETTYEHLEFAIPAAYLHWKDDLAGGKQKKIVMSVHWPSGDPHGFHENLEPYNQHSAGWPIEKYFLELKSSGSPIINKSAEERARLMRAFLWQDSDRRTPNPYTGNYCGWESFDEINKGANTLEHWNSKSGVTSELYFDSSDPEKWQRRIVCGPDMRVCHLHTDYQRFALEISFSPLNICKADDFEKQARGLLDKFLIAHHPPTRMWSPDEPGQRRPYENSNEWTRSNLNNPDIRKAAE